MKSSAAQHHRLRRRGIILVVILVLVAMISLAGFSFRGRMATEYEATLIGGDLRQARQTLASAETYLVSLADYLAGWPEPYTWFAHDPQMFSAQTVNAASAPEAPNASESVRRRWRFSVVDQLPAVVANSAQDQEFTDSATPVNIRFGMKNESSKLHLVRAMMWDLETPGAGREALMQIPGMTPEAADSILDWLDSDDDPREFGAEAEHYSRLDRPYTPRNGLPESLEELLFVKGVTREAFYGQGPQQFDGAAQVAWSDLLTIHSAEPNTDRHGEDRIDLNELYPSDYSSGTVVGDSGAVDVSFLPSELVKYILLLRLYGATFPSESTATSPGTFSAVQSSSTTPLAQISIPQDESLDLIDIESLCDLIDSSVQLPQSAGGQLVASPLTSARSEFLEIMNVLEERVTVDIDDQFTGRININSAPEIVLRALVGDAESAARIVQQRAMVENWERETPAWLLTRQIVDLPTYRRIYPHITTRGAVHSGEIIVYREFGGPYLRRRLTIDASSKPTHRIAWTDLTSQGLPVETSALRYQGSDFDTELRR